ncbi:MAG: GNAT family N-acetyltransferase, partial [Pseudomonadota bacterium]
PDARSRGLGRRLMGEIEREAAARGAGRALLDTYSWQAEEFYAGLGYGELARVAYPAGAERIYMVKDLP